MSSPRILLAIAAAVAAVVAGGQRWQRPPRPSLAGVSVSTARLSSPVGVEHLTREGAVLRHEWAFARSPGAGPLDVEVEFDGAVLRAVDEQGAHLSTGHLYSHATWVDARGRRTPVPARACGERVCFRVEAKVLEQSEYPALLDPLLSLAIPVGVPEPGLGVLGGQPVSTAWSAGRGVIVWMDSRMGHGRRSLWVRGLDARLLPLGAGATALPAGHAFTVPPHSLAAQQGTFVQTAVVPEPSAGPSALVAMRFDVGGLIDATPLRIASGNYVGTHSVAAHGDGFVLAWRTPTDVSSRTLSATGALGPVSSLGALPSFFQLASEGPTAWYVWAEGTPSRLQAAALDAAGARTAPLTLLDPLPGNTLVRAAVRDSVLAVCAVSYDPDLTIGLYRFDTSGARLSTAAYPPFSLVSGGGVVEVSVSAGETVCGFRPHFGNDTLHLARFDSSGATTEPALVQVAASSSASASDGPRIILARTFGFPQASELLELSALRPVPDSGPQWNPVSPAQYARLLVVGASGGLLVTSSESLAGVDWYAHTFKLEPGAATGPGLKLPFSADVLGAVPDEQGFTLLTARALADGGTALELLHTADGLTSAEPFPVMPYPRAVAPAPDGGVELFYVELSETVGRPVALHRVTSGPSGTADELFAPIGLEAGDPEVRQVASTRALGRHFVALTLSNRSTFTCQLLGRVVGSPRDDGGLQPLGSFPNECGSAISQVITNDGWALAWDDEDRGTNLTLASLDGVPRSTSQLRLEDGGVLPVQHPSLLLTPDGGLLVVATARQTFDGLWTAATDFAGGGLDGGATLAASGLNAVIGLTSPVAGGYLLAFPGYDPTPGVENIRTQLHLVRFRAPAAPEIVDPLQEATVRSPVSVRVLAESFAQVRLTLNGSEAGTTWVAADGVATFTPPLAPGRHTAMAVAVDAVGGQSAPSAPVSFSVVDRAAYQIGCDTCSGRGPSVVSLLTPVGLALARKRRARRSPP